MSPLRVGAALGGIVLAAVVVFSLGVMVGKRVAESVPPAAAPPTALPTENLPPRPTAQAAGPEAAVPPEHLTFYDRLSGAVPPAPAAPPEPAAPARAPGASAVEPAAEAAPPAAAPVASARVAPSRAARAEDQAPPDAGQQIRKLTGRGRFAVQVAAVNDRASAEQTATRLKRQGFDVVTVMASIKGKTWYRIRVGDFPNQQAATKAAGLFRSGFGLNAIAVRE